METKDLIVIGGGINGAGIAVDAAGRGLSVLMLEANDLACATSSASSKLIHGGLRYLEHYEFRLVSEALAEREVLLKMAPHLAIPMRFRLPHRPHLRPAWMIRIGLFMYDHLGKRTSLPGSTGLRFGSESVLKPEIVRGFEYSDCWVDDARLVLANAQMVEKKGGEVKTRTRAIAARRENGLWIVEAEDVDTGEKFSWKARGLVNATGPWVKQFFDDGMHLPSPYGIRLIKGSHIVVPRVHTQKQAYILQNEDKRIVFVIPWMDEFSIIGTTDVEYKGDPKNVEIEESEVSYLLKVYNAHFKNSWRAMTWSGPTPACVRCVMTSLTHRRPSPVTIRLIFMTWTVRRRCCRCLAVSSPPTVNWRSMRWRNWRRITKASARRGRKAPCCLAAISAITATITPRSCVAASRSLPKEWRATTPAPTAAIPNCSSATRKRLPIWASILAMSCTKRNCATWWNTSGCAVWTMPSGVVLKKGCG